MKHYPPDEVQEMATKCRTSDDKGHFASGYAAAAMLEALQAEVGSLYGMIDDYNDEYAKERDTLQAEVERLQRIKATKPLRREIITLQSKLDTAQETAHLWHNRYDSLMSETHNITETLREKASYFSAKLDRAMELLEEEAVDEYCECTDPADCPSRVCWHCRTRAFLKDAP